MNRLQHKSAIVFGGGPNIGGTIAHFLAREGARVTVSDDDPKRSQEAVEFLNSKGYESIAASTHYVDEDGVARVFAESEKRFGPPDIVVNTAGQINWGSVVDIGL